LASEAHAGRQRNRREQEGVGRDDDVAATLRAASRFVAPERMIACTNCGMAPLPRDVAAGKLRALGAGAALYREEIAAG